MNNGKDLYDHTITDENRNGANECLASFGGSSGADRGTSGQHYERELEVRSRRLLGLPFDSAYQIRPRPS